MPAAKSKAPTPEEVRKARAFLRRRGIGTHQIPPRRFAAAAKEQNKTFTELLRFIGRLLDGAQNEAAQRREKVSKAAGVK
jgi:tRNA isopentenyl-2-thiomethyl-A-37 hydroxylase MiaE